jgi:PAS domain S-box-containing protein
MSFPIMGDNGETNLSPFECCSTTDENMALLETLFQNAPVGFALVDREFRYVRVNAALNAIHACPAGSQIGRTVAEVVPHLWPALEPLYRRALAGETILNHDLCGAMPAEEARDRHWLVSYYPIRRDNEVIGIGLIVNDITLRKQAENALTIRNNLYAMLAGANQAVIRCRASEQLYREVCAIAVETGRFRFAWIGVAEENQVRIAASAGDDRGYMENLVITLDEADPRSHGPTGRAARTAQSCVINDFMSSPTTAHWHERARQVGLAASAAFPLKERGRVVAVLTLYADVADFFTEDLAETLNEIASAISLALDGFVQERDRQREEEERRDLEEQLKNLHEVSLILTQSETLDTLCRRAVELGRERFGFDRLSLWLIADDPDQIQGTYGTDEAGGTRAEHQQRMRSTADSRQKLFADRVVDVIEDWPHSNEWGAWVGRGWHMTAALRDGAVVIGVLNADNHLRHHPLREYQIELLGLYGAVVGHLYAHLQREKALQESEARFRAIFVGSAVGIALVDRNGYPLLCNPALLEMLGYSEDEFRRMTFKEFTHPDDVTRDWRLYQELVEGRREAYQIEKRYLRKDGAIIWGRLAVSLVRDAEGVARFGIGMVENITERKQAEQSLQDSLQRLHTLTSHLQSVREEERASIAREVHDELGQALTGLKIELAWLRRHTAAQSDAMPATALLEKMDSMNGLIEQTIKTVRRIATELRPAILDTFGLVPALEWQTVDFQNRTGIACSFNSELETMPLDSKRATAVFRIAQESLTNTLRHARATRVRVSLESRDGTLILTIQDNGIGIREKNLQDPLAFGLLGMRERALLLGGDLQISGTPRKGTTVRLQFPIDSDRNMSDPASR